MDSPFHAFSAGARARADPNINPVGAEYILMDKICGVPLYTRWDALRGDNVRTVIDQVIAMEQRFAWYRFSQIGSLFYKEDVEPALRERPLYEAGNEADNEGAERFRIGPLVDWAVWRGSRASMDADRGPCAYLYLDSRWSGANVFMQGRIHCRTSEVSSVSSSSGCDSTISPTTEICRPISTF